MWTKELSRSLLCLSLLCFSTQVFSAFDQVRINELFAGYNGDSSVQFVELLVPDNEQKQWGPNDPETIGRASLSFFNANGQQTGRFVFSSHAPSGGNTILVATQSFADLSNVPQPDFIMLPEINANSGKVCFTNNSDNNNASVFTHCISYGDFKGDDSGEGSPIDGQLAILGAVSLSRHSNFDFASTVIGNVDFSYQTPTPANSASTNADHQQNNASNGTHVFVANSLVVQGENLFNKETFAGNGRTCLTCHIPPMFNMTPTHVANKAADDALFVGHEDINVNALTVSSDATSNTAQPSDLRGVISDSLGRVATVVSGTGSHYLIKGGLQLSGEITDNFGNRAIVNSVVAGDLAGPNSFNGSTNGLEQTDNRLLTSSNDIRFPQGRALVHENIDGFAALENFRKSPALVNIKDTAPFGLSGEFADLASFSENAVRQHATRSILRREGVDFRLPTSAELEALVAFQESITLEPPAFFPGGLPVANATTLLQRRGENEFFGVGCRNCHFGPNLSLHFANRKNDVFNTGVANQSINEFDNLPSEPPSAGQGSSVRAFNTPQLIGVRFNAPYFHDNSAKDLDEVVSFYVSPQFKAAIPSLPPGSAGFLEFISVFEPEAKAGLVSFLNSVAPLPVSNDHIVTFGHIPINQGHVVDIPIQNTSNHNLTISAAKIVRGFLGDLRFVNEEKPNLFTEYPLSFEQQSKVVDFELTDSFLDPPLSEHYEIVGDVVDSEIAPGEIFNVSVNFAPNEILEHISGHLELSLQDESGESWEIGIRLTGEGLQAVIDTEPPVFTSDASDIQVEATEVMTPVVIPLPTATDNSGNVFVENTTPADSRFPLGTTSITERASDAAGNEVTRTRNVIVVDTTGPFIPELAEIFLEAEGEKTIVNLAPPAATDIFGISRIENDLPDQGFFVHRWPVKWVVTDNNGLSSSAIQYVTIQDTTAPLVTVEDLTIQTADSGIAMSLANPLATDVVGVVSIENNAPNFFPLGETVVTWTVSDASGNETIANQTVYVVAGIGPSFPSLPVIEVTATGEFTQIVLDVPVVQDEDGVATVVSNAPAKFSIGDTEVEWIATDGLGFESTTVQLVRIIDRTAPELTVPVNVDVILDETAESYSGDIGQATATDWSEFEISSNAPEQFFPGETIVIWTATDVFGNKTIGQQKVVVSKSEQIIASEDSQTKSMDNTEEPSGQTSSTVTDTSVDNDDVNNVENTTEESTTFTLSFDLLGLFALFIVAICRRQPVELTY